MRLADLRIGPRIGLVVLAAVLGMLAILAVEAVGLRNTLISYRQDKLRNVTEVAIGIINTFYEKAQAGEMSEADAQAAAFAAVEALRYDENE